MAMADYLVVMLRAAYEKSFSQLWLCSEDMKAACRQLSLPDSQTRISITAVYSPEHQTAKLFEMFGQPLGAQHAVPNFYRAAEWINRLLIRGYHLLLGHFFDDFFLVDLPPCAQGSIFCLRLTGLYIGP